MDPTCWQRDEVQSCLRRIGMWRVPPHYSYRDWMDEMTAQCAAAAVAAERHYDPDRGVPRSAFVHRRILEAALARYRQEWRYALRCTSEVEAEALPTTATDEYSAVVQREWLDAGMRHLGARDRLLVTRLYGDLCTEAEVASELLVTQQAVSKHKAVVLRHLRGFLADSAPERAGARHRSRAAGAVA